MATTVAAIRGKMGEIAYYQTKMRAQEFVKVTRAASDDDDWANQGIEERLQRELHKTRALKEIAPYLAKSKDRFFGSFIVLLKDADTAYESLHEIVKNIPRAYASEATDMGFLTINGGQMIVLDGQHRRQSLRHVIEREVEGPYLSAVGDDELTVIFVEYKGDEQTRRIFNKINRNAKPTGRSDNIITSEDDGNAILTRRLLNDGEPLGIRVPLRKKKGNRAETSIVNWDSNTLADRSPQLTTISAVYETVRDILRAEGIKFSEKDDIVRPDDEVLDEAYGHVWEWWRILLAEVDAFRLALANPSAIPEMRVPDEEYSLLLRPAAHIILVRALIKAIGHGVDLHEAIRRANKINWSIKDPLWRDVLIIGNDRIVARAENYDVTSDLIAYLISADKMSEAMAEAVRGKIARFLPDEVYELPEPIAA